MKSDPIAQTVLELLHKAPRNLLVIGGFSFGDAPIGDRIRHIAHLREAAGLGETFDAAIWRVDPQDVADGANLHALLEPRARLLVVVDGGLRRAVLLELFAAAFCYQRERLPIASEVSVIELRRDDFPVREFREGDRDQILELFTPSFFAERSPLHWQWKFDDNPWGQRLITVAFAADGNLVGHYAGYPVPWVHAAPKAMRQLPCLQIGDTMTDARYRGFGRGPTSVLGRCIRHFYTAHCEGRVAFNYGFNTGNIQKFSMLFAGAERLEPVGFWVRSAAAFPRPPRYRVRESAFDDGLTGFFSRAAPAYGLLVRRDAPYLRWRYQQCPDSPPFLMLVARSFWRTVGWAVFRRRGDTLRWCDALFLPEHGQAAATILQAALEHPLARGVSAIEGWFPPRPRWWRQILADLGFSARPEPNDLALMLVPHLERDARRLLLEDSYYTMGDSDLA